MEVTTLPYRWYDEFKCSNSPEGTELRKEELVDFILDMQTDIKAGRSVEYRKLEIKRTWWTCGVREQEEEFYKDLSHDRKYLRRDWVYHCWTG